MIQQIIKYKLKKYNKELEFTDILIPYFFIYKNEIIYFQ